MLGQRMNSCFILIYQSSLSGTLLPTFSYRFPAPHKALHFWKVNFSKQESVGGQRRHYLGPWEAWVCLWGCNLLFFLVFISESWRIFNRVPMQTASCRWRVIWKPQHPFLVWLERPLIAEAMDECGWGVRDTEAGCCWEFPLNSAWASKTSEKSLPNRTVQANLMATW